MWKQPNVGTPVPRVCGCALVALREKERSSLADDNGHYDDAVREMLNFVEKNRTPLQGVSVKQLIHEGHRL